jgi:hydroxyacylglutathione hydrolase
MQEKFKMIKTPNNNFFVLKAGEDYLLIDTGISKSYEKFKEKLINNGIDPTKVKYIFITHNHLDHILFVSNFCKENGAKIIVHKDEVEPMETSLIRLKELIKRNLFVKLLYWFFDTFIFSKSFVFEAPKVTENDYIIEGDNFELLKEIGIDGIILHTPGHTKGSLSVLLSDGTAFIGDLAVNVTSPGPRPTRKVDNREDVFKSWDRLKEYGAKMFYTAHGRPFPTEEMIARRNALQKK